MKSRDSETSISPMKIFRLSVAAAVIFLAAAAAALAQPDVYSGSIVGYVNTPFRVGDNLFGNPLQYTNNSLSYIIPTAPEGTTVSLWNPAGNTYSPVSTFTAGAWNIDFTLNPGTGAKLHTTSSFTNTFVGTVLAPNGTVWDGLAINPPAPFSGANGSYLLSSKFPVLLSETNAFPVFQYILGRGPQEGEQFTTFDPLTQQYHTTTFTAGGWDHGAPQLAVGEAAFFNVGPVNVPEPSVVGLVIAGLGFALRANRRR